MEEIKELFITDLENAVERVDVEGWIDADILEKQLGVYVTAFQNCDFFKVSKLCC